MRPRRSLYVMDPYAIIEIDYDFQFHTSEDHLEKVVLTKVRAIARLFDRPAITVERTFYRPGIDAIHAKAYVYPGCVTISKDDRLYLMSRINHEINRRKAKANEASVLEEAKSQAYRIMRDSYDEYLQDMMEVA